MSAERRRQITDVRALRALADPVRYRILGHLMAVGPQTASQCAVIVGATASNCSYHLRELARYGLVERVPAGEGDGDGRERPWRPTATGFTYGPPAGQPGDPVAADAHRQLLHAGVEAEAQLAHAAIDRHDDWPAAWQQAESMATYGLLVDAGELLSLTAAIDALLRPYIGLTREDVPAEARPVHLAVTAVRTPEA
jgi:DNA-binding transcriptional ArsR family regulator